MFSARENVVMCPAFFAVGFGFNFPSWPVSSSFNAVAGRLRTRLVFYLVVQRVSLFLWYSALGLEILGSLPMHRCSFVSTR